MALIPYRPFWDIDKWFDDEAADWPQFASQTPRIDIYEEGDNIMAQVELPGVDPKTIDAKIEDNMLKIEAKSEEEKEEKEKGFYRKEISRKYYKRSVMLPVEVLEDKAEAEYEDGMLKVRVPKAKLEPKKEAKKLDVKTK